MICAVLLAAGRSRRMGVQKLLLPFGSSTVLAHVADQLLEGGIERLFVVVGHDRERIALALEGIPVTLVSNPAAQSNMLDSVRCGLRSAPPECEAVMVALGDQPRITAQLVRDLLQSFAETEKPILVPLHAGRRGHPILFSQRCFEDVLTQFDGVGLRGLLRSRPEAVFEHEVSDAAILSDMDRPEDYEREMTLYDPQELLSQHEPARATDPVDPDVGVPDAETARSRSH